MIQEGDQFYHYRLFDRSHGSSSQNGGSYKAVCEPNSSTRSGGQYPANHTDRTESAAQHPTRIQVGRQGIPLDHLHPPHDCPQDG